MSRRPSPARKTLNAANLARLGPERLAGLLLAAAAGDGVLKRKLKLELAAAAGAADLALEIDRRLQALAASRARVSWRKRPEMLADLRHHLDAVTGPLQAADPVLAWPRLMAWFDLFPELSRRIKDPKGEVEALFREAAARLGPAAEAAGAARAAADLGEALSLRFTEWSGWVLEAAAGLSTDLAALLLDRLGPVKPGSAPRRLALTRRLALRAGRIDAWAESFSELERRRPEVAGALAERLAAADRRAEARAALERGRPGAHAPATEAARVWREAEIKVLQAEGDAEGLQAARWRLFETDLDPAALRALLRDAPDFDDVALLDRALDLAMRRPDAAGGLGFLMAWPALREAAGLVLSRTSELELDADLTALWAGRLAGRHPAAALALVRNRALQLARRGPPHAEEVRRLAAEAREMAETPGALDGVPSHAAFIDALEAATRPVRRLWR